MDNEQTHKTRPDRMVNAVLEMVRELVTPDLLRDVETAAAESDNGESDKPIIAKIGLSLQWPAGQKIPAMECKLSYSVRHVAIADRVVDDTQTVLPFSAMGGAQ
jgi:hypothetical protein